LTLKQTENKKLTKKISKLNKKILKATLKASGSDTFTQCDVACGPSTCEHGTSTANIPTVFCEDYFYLLSDDGVMADPIVVFDWSADWASMENATLGTVVEKKFGFQLVSQVSTNADSSDIESTRTTVTRSSCGLALRKTCSGTQTEVAPAMVEASTETADESEFMVLEFCPEDDFFGFQSSPDEEEVDIDWELIL
jgi:hypothetical protein